MSFPLVVIWSRRVDGGSPFDALRVTTTRSDGSEHVGLVGNDQSQRDRIDTILDGVLKELQVTVGSPHRACKALLAVLGERLLSEQADSDDEAALDFPRVKARHG